LEIVKSLRGVSFDWKETGKSSYGVIAQELQEVLPELVKNGEVKSVNYNGLIGVLIEGMKSQQEQINRLEQKIQELTK
jgi:polyhydroxyalkanoate synthesis regulator phasin